MGISVTGRGGPWGCEMLRHCFDRLFGIWGEDKIVEIVFPQVGFHG
jgi:hypothetical protein